MYLSLPYTYQNDIVRYDYFRTGKEKATHPVTELYTSPLLGYTMNGSSHFPTLFRSGVTNFGLTQFVPIATNCPVLCVKHDCMASENNSPLEVCFSSCLIRSSSKYITHLLSVLSYATILIYNN